MKYSELKNIKYISQRLLIEESLARGINVDYLNKKQGDMAFFELSYKNHFEYISGGIISKMTAITHHCVTNKYLTKIFLERKKINVSKGMLFSKKNIAEAFMFIKKIGYPIVVKKNDGSRGNLVFVGIKNQKDCNLAIKKILKKNNYILVEKEFKGKEFRFVVSRDKVFAVTNREPANVIGDGIYNIKELIKAKNSDPKRGEHYRSPLVKIKIDKTIKQNLFEQGININYIPNKGEKIYLRKEAAISTGGDSIDVTDRVHSDIKKIAIKTIKAIPGLAYAGVDFMTNQDISKKPTKNSYIIIEINSYPGIFMHYSPYQGKSRNVAKGIIDILFPETRGKYIKK